MEEKNNIKLNKQPAPGGRSGAKAVKWLHVLLILLVTTGVYSTSLYNDFAYDDISVIIENTLIRDFRNIPLFFTGLRISSSQGFEKGFRPLVMASFALNYKLGGLNVAGYHAVNIFFHTANAVLVYLLVVLLVCGGRNSPRRDKGGYEAAVFSSLLFAVHPVNSEAVNYIWQRSELLVSFFYLLGLILFIRFLTNRRRVLYLFSISSYIMALTCKETAVTFPLVILLFDRYCVSGSKRDKFFRDIKEYHLPFILITFIYLTASFFGLDIIKEFSSPGKVDAFTYFLAQPGIVLRYLSLIIMPTGLSVCHVVTAPVGMLDAKVMCSFAAIMIMVFIGIRLKKISVMSSFFILWFFIILIPTSSILPLHILMNEHRIYLPGIGIYSVLAILLFKYVPEKLGKRVLPVFLSVFIIMLSVLTVRRNADWNDGVRLWSKVLGMYPGAVKALNNRAVAFEKKEMYDESISDLNRSIKLNPGNSDSYNNRGNVYIKKGFFDLAVTDCNRAVELDAGCFKAYCTRGTAYGRKGFYEIAILDFNRGLDINPEYAPLYIGRGMVYKKMGLDDRAIKDFGRGVEIDPGNAGGYYNRGLIYREKGFYDRAITDYNRAIEVNPGFSNAYNNRGIVYGLKGILDRALNDFNRALELDPGNRNARKNHSLISGEIRKHGKKE